MNLFEVFTTTDLIDEPKTFPLSETASVTMLPTGGEKGKRAFQRMMEPYGPRLNAGGELTDAEMKALNVKFYSEVIVKGWTGINGEDGKPVEFSKENAAKFFADDRIAAFFALLIRMSQNEDAFKKAKDESDEGNS